MTQALPVVQTLQACYGAGNVVYPVSRVNAQSITVKTTSTAKWGKQSPWTANNKAIQMVQWLIDTGLDTMKKNSDLVQPVSGQNSRREGEEQNRYTVLAS